MTDKSLQAQIHAKGGASASGKRAPRKKFEGRSRAFGRTLHDLQTENTASGLLPAEEKLLTAAIRGTECFLIEELSSRVLKQELCLLPDPGAEREGVDVRVRGEFLRYLALGADSDHILHGNGIYVWCAHLLGNVDLNNREVTFPLSFRNCWFEKPIDLRGARIRSLSMAASRVPGIYADGAVVEGSLYLSDGFRCDGGLNINGIEIRGSLACDGGQFLAEVNTIAISGRAARIKGDVFLRTGTRVVGQVYLATAEIGGSIECTGASLLNRRQDGRGIALLMQGATVKENVFLNADFRPEGICDFRSEGQISLRNTQISGELNCSGGKFINRRGNVALDATGMDLRGHFVLQKTKSLGEWSFFGAKIGGSVDCVEARFLNRGSGESGRTFTAAHSRITGHLHLHGRFQGLCSLQNTKIGGNLECSGSRFSNRAKDGTSWAIDAGNSEVDGSVNLRSVIVSGYASLYRAEIGGDLDCEAARFLNFTSDGQSVALSASLADVKGNVRLCSGFRAEGLVDLLGADIGRQLACGGGSFNNPAAAIPQPKQNASKRGKFPFHKKEMAPIAEFALLLQGAKVGETLFLGPAINNPKDVTINGTLSLVGAYASSFSDRRQSWPPDYIQGASGTKLRCCIDLDGFVYDRLSGVAEVTASTPRGWLQFTLKRLLGSNEPPIKTRKDWLSRRMPDDLGTSVSHQPFAQLIRVLRAAGHDEDARIIAQQKQMFRHEEWQQTAKWPRRLLLDAVWWLFGRLTGYGYRPERLIVLLLAIWFGCSLFYKEAATQGTIAPSNPSVYSKSDLSECRSEKGNWTACPAFNKLYPEYTRFNPYIYSADIMLPVVDFQQKRLWAPVGTTVAPASMPAWLPWAVVWVQTIAGWIGSLVLVGLVTGYLIKLRVD